MVVEQLTCLSEALCSEARASWRMLGAAALAEMPLELVAEMPLELVAEMPLELVA